MTVSKFLNLIASKLREERPLIPKNHNYTIKEYENIIHFWFRTDGCRYTQNGNGGCLMCDYSSSTRSSTEELITYVLEGLQNIEKMPASLLINSSGSFFDTQEVSKDVRLSIYNELSKYDNLEIILETLLETITEDKLIEVKSILKTQKIDIEFGLENIDSIILKYCVNKKKFDLNMLRSKIQLIKKYKMNPVANILVGVPFLSDMQIIETSVKTVHEAFSFGIEYVVIFPINIKDYTVVNWLYQNNLYEVVSLWTYIEVLNQIDEKYLTNVELVWYKNRKPNNPLIKNEFKTPIACSKCNSKVLLLLDQFNNFPMNRSNVLRKINHISCECKDRWRININKNNDFKKNIIESYSILGKNILGKREWDKVKYDIFNEIESDFNSNILHNKIADIYDYWITGDYTSNDFIEFYNKLTSKINKNIEIVELGIGTGRISLEIVKNQKRKVLGIDHSKEMLNKCQEKINKSCLEDYFELLQMDIRNLKLKNKAHFIMLPFRTIGHFLTIEDKKKLFEKIYDNLNKGGIFVVDHYILDEDWARKHNEVFIEMYNNNGLTIYDKYKFDFNLQRLQCTIYEQTKENKIEKASFNYSWILPSQMKTILLEVGFKIKHIYGDFNFNELNETSEEQIWIVEK